MAASTASSYGPQSVFGHLDYRTAETHGARVRVMPSRFSGVGINAFMRALPAAPIIRSVSVGFSGGAVWIVTEVMAQGALDGLDPIYEAEAKARRASPEEALVFRIVDKSIGERLVDGPDKLIPIR